MKSVMDELDPAEREALQNGSRKRKAPVGDSQLGPKNLQQKKVAAGSGPRIPEDEDEDLKAMRALV